MSRFLFKFIGPVTKQGYVEPLDNYSSLWNKNEFSRLSPDTPVILWLSKESESFRQGVCHLGIWDCLVLLWQGCLLTVDAHVWVFCLEPVCTRGCVEREHQQSLRSHKVKAQTKCYSHTYCFIIQLEPTDATGSANNQSPLWELDATRNCALWVVLDSDFHLLSGLSDAGRIPEGLLGWKEVRW